MQNYLATPKRLAVYAALFLWATGASAQVAPENTTKAPPPPWKIAGVWQVVWERTPGMTNLYGSEPDLKPEAKARLDQQTAERKAGIVRGNLSGQCIPPGMPSILFYIGADEILVDDKKIVWIIEQFNSIRWIWMDGRSHPPPEELKPTFNGHSIGHWEGDTLVIDTIGISTQAEIFSGRLNNETFPHSEQLHIVERIRPLDGGKLFVNDYTVTDPAVLNTPWHVSIRFERHDEWETAEFVCEENNQFSESETPP